MTSNSDEPYVFVCYAHNDESVIAEIKRLREHGINLWYDQGITPGEDWNDELGEAIAGADKLIFFVSPNSVDSRHCRNEIHFAQQHHVPVIAIHLRHVEFPKGMELMLASTQAILKYSLTSQAYKDKLLSTLGSPPAEQDQVVDQEVRFCTARDGVTLAYASVGQGPPFVKAGNWLNHLEFDWQSPVWRHLFRALSSDHTLIRYDPRGNGLSDWNVDDLSFEACVNDLETVVDAAGVSDFPLLGISQGCAISIAYTIRHPERVSRLILHGGFAVGRNHRSDETRERGIAFSAIMRQGWGQDNPAFRQLFTSLFIPDGTAEQTQWFNELARITTSPENAAQIFETNCEVDVRDLLAQVTVPTLVLHSREDGMVPFDQGRLLATAIPGARFVALESKDHLILDHEPAWDRFMAEVNRFLSE